VADSPVGAAGGVTSDGTAGVAEAAVEAAAELGPGHIGVGCDVADRTACGKAAGRVIDEFGRIDILVNNAGVTQPVKIMEIDTESWDRILDINLRGTFFLSQAIGKWMIESVNKRDYFVVQAYLMVAVAWMVAVALLAQVARHLLDPRERAAPS